MKKVATFLKLMFILAVVGGLGYQCLSSGYKHYETQAESGLNIPENATDINVYTALMTWKCYDFKTDFETYKQWVANYKGNKLSPITESTLALMSYNKKQNKILFRENIKHFRASWTIKDSGAYLMYVLEEGRAYYAAHSR